MIDYVDTVSRCNIYLFCCGLVDNVSVAMVQRKLDDLVDRGYVHRSDITDHIMQALEGMCDFIAAHHSVSWFSCSAC